MPTGWRPEDVSKQYPVYKIDDVYDFEKYDPQASKGLQIWSMTQLIFLLLFISFLLANIASIGSPGIFLYGGFIFLYIYAMTELMDNSRLAIYWEGMKMMMGFYLIYTTGGWFGAQKFLSVAPYMVVAYLLLAMYLSISFSIKRNVSVPSERMRS
jgi:hypothetical protein